MKTRRNFLNLFISITFLFVVGEKVIAQAYYTKNILDGSAVITTASGVQLINGNKGTITIGNVDGVFTFTSLNPNGSSATNSSGRPCNSSVLSTYISNQTVGFYVPSPYVQYYTVAKDVKILDKANSVVIVTGYMKPQSGSNKDIFVSLMKPSGEVLLTRSYGSANDEVANAIFCGETDLNGITPIFIAGYTEISGSKKIFVMRIDDEYSISTSFIHTLTPVWNGIYDAATYVSSVLTNDPDATNEEAFDMVQSEDLLYIVGSKDESGTKVGILLQLMASTGDVAPSPYAFNASISQSLLGTSVCRSVSIDYSSSKINIGCDGKSTDVPATYLNNIIYGKYDIGLQVLDYLNFYQINANGATGDPDCYIRSVITSSSNGFNYLFAEETVPSEGIYDVFILPLDYSGIPYQITKFIDNNTSTNEFAAKITEDIDDHFITLHMTSDKFNPYGTIYNPVIINAYYNGITQCPVGNNLTTNLVEIAVDEQKYIRTLASISDYALCELPTPLDASLICYADYLEDGGDSPESVELLKKSRSDQLLSSPKTDIFTKVYPNPFSNQLSIDLGKRNGAEIRIFSLQGQLLFTQQINKAGVSEVHFPEDLSLGIYFLQINSEKYIKLIHKE